MTVTVGLTCAVMAVGAPAAMATRYAAPGGDAMAPCTLADPCTIATAVTGATVIDNDVRLLAGDYPPITTVVTTPTQLTIIPQLGSARPVIHFGNGGQLRVFHGSQISYADIVADTAAGVDPLFLADANSLGAHLRVSGTIPGAAVRIGAIGVTPATLRDSTVVNTSTAAGSSAVVMECNGCSSVARLVNTTAIATGGAGLRVIAAGAGGTATTTMDVVNTIASSGTGADVRATGFGDKAVVNLDHSAWEDQAVSATDATITDLGGRVSGPVTFIDAAGGDLRLAPGSAAIDAGMPEAGAFSGDVLGRPRFLGLAIDIGGHESSPAPRAMTAGAGGITATGATLTGSVFPMGSPTNWRFEYGLTTAYGTTVSGLPAQVDGLTSDDVSVTLSGLAPTTTYHYRLVAEHLYGSGAGADGTFTTTALPAAPARPPAPGPGPGPGPGGRTPPPLAKGCLSVRDFTLAVRGGKTARSIAVTVDGRRASVTRGAAIRARANLRGTPKKIVVVKVVVTSASGKKTTTVRRYRTCSKKRAGKNQLKA